jgi:hypothetical protein
LPDASNRLREVTKADVAAPHIEVNLKHLGRRATINQQHSVHQDGETNRQELPPPQPLTPAQPNIAREDLVRAQQRGGASRLSLSLRSVAIRKKLRTTFKAKNRKALMRLRQDAKYYA